MTAVLHSPLRIGGVTIRNRLYRAPVLEGAGSGDDAAATYQRHFVANAEHGVGLIIQGSSCIYEEGRSSPGMTCVDTREKVLRLAPMVAVVQAAIAAEPKPVHVPRERPPVVAVDEGPLVLVETRRDLRDLTLPFEAPAAQPPQA